MDTGSQDPTKGPSPTVPSIAFFDLDGTIVRGHTQVLLVRFMREYGAVGRLYETGALLWFLGYKLRLLKLTRQARERGAAMFKGLTPAETEKAMMRFAEEVLRPRLHPEVVEAMGEHKAQGRRVVVVSAALEPVVKALCGLVGADEYAGAGCEEAEGRYTGRIVGAIPHSEEKTRIAAAFAARVGALASDCWAYGDHETDLSLLGWAGHPVAVDPRPRLLAAARQAGWPILS